MKSLAKAGRRKPKFPRKRLIKRCVVQKSRKRRAFPRAAAAREEPFCVLQPALKHILMQGHARLRMETAHQVRLAHMQRARNTRRGEIIRQVRVDIPLRAA